MAEDNEGPLSQENLETTPLIPDILKAYVAENRPNMSPESVNQETPTTPPDNANSSKPASSWAWDSWGSVLSTLQEVAVEAQKTANNAANEVIHQLDSESFAIEPETSSQVVVDDGKRSTLLPEGMEAGLMHLDESVESLASGALQALGNAWQGGIQMIPSLDQLSQLKGENMVDKETGQPENSLNFTDPSVILQSGRDLAAQGLNLLEYMSRETVEALAKEAGIELEQEGDAAPGAGAGAGAHEGAGGTAEEGLGSAETFDDCFYIYGGPEHMEALNALSDHHSLLLARALSKQTAQERAWVAELRQAMEKEVLLLADQLPLLLPVENEQQQAPARADCEAGTSGPAEQERQAVLATSLQSAQELKEQVPSLLAGVQGGEASRVAGQHIQAVSMEAVHRCAELSALSVASLALLAKQVPEAGQEASSESASQKAVAAAQRLQPSALRLALDLISVARAFLAGIREAGQQGALRLAEEEALGSALKECAAIAEEKVEEHCREGVLKIQEGLSLLPAVLSSACVKTAVSSAAGTTPGSSSKKDASAVDLG